MKLAYGVSLGISLLAVGLLDCYLVALLYSALEQVAVGGWHRAYLIALFSLLVGVGLLLLIPFALPARWLGDQPAVYVGCAAAALLWLVVGAVAAKMFGL